MKYSRKKKENKKITNSELKKELHNIAIKFIFYIHALSLNYQLTRLKKPPLSSSSGLPSSFDLSNDSFGSFSCLPVEHEQDE